MAQRSLFMNSAPGDPRRYTAQDIASYYAGVFSNGIMNNGTSTVYSTSVQAGTMNSVVTPGKAIINGFQSENTENVTLEHPLAEPTLDRIDRIVLRMNLNADVRKILLFVKPGVPSASPQPPELQRDEWIWELSLAQVRVRQNTVQLLPADMTDERLNTDLCGIVTLNPKIPTDGFQQQWDDFMAGITDDGFTPMVDFTAHKADGAAHGIGDKATLLTTNKASIVGAMNELFTNANSLKTDWAGVVGSPLVASDTSAQLKSKTQTIKNTLATNLSAKGQPSTGAEDLAVLANKVADVSTGSKRAEAYVSKPTTTDVISVRNLTFRPAFIAVKNEVTPGSWGTSPAVYYPSWGNTNNFTIFNDGFEYRSVNSYVGAKYIAYSE